MESCILNQILQKEGIVEKDLEHFLITLSSSHFFNKTDFEWYYYCKGGELCKKNKAKLELIKHTNSLTKSTEKN